MSRLNCVIDTSAAISLGSTSKFQLSTNLFSFISTNRVKDELIEISKTTDKLGKIADSILKSLIIEFVNMEKELQNSKGEVEVINLANKLKADLVLMDDIQARKKLQKQCDIPIRFSPFVIFFLCEKDILKHKEGWLAIEDMKVEREWKENLIIDYAELLFKKAVK